jgi:tripartite-type tricarboxylate transporter receptor subunit TctC
MQRFERVATIVLATLIAWSTSNAAAAAESAEDFPSRPIHLVVPFPAGSGTDILARVIAQQISLDWKQPVVVENRVGASTIVGTNLVARAAPDGYTVVMASNNHVINVALFPKLPFDPIKDFAPIGKVAVLPFLLVVNPSLPVKSVKDLVDLARSEPGKLDYASSSNGTPPHVAGEMFKQMAGINMQHVPFRGSADAVTAVIGNTVSLMFVNTMSALPQVRSGQLRAIAVGSPRRIAALPDLPTVAESGYPGFDVNLWAGLLAPAKTPKAIIDKFNAELVHALATPEVQKSFAMQGAESTPSTPEQFGSFMVDEMARLGKIARDANMHVD